MIKILIVDDESEKLKQIKNIINGFKVVPDEDIIIAHSAKEARGYLRETFFDLMILDLNLPDVFGEETLEEGGYSLLQELRTIKSYNKPEDILVLTSFKELHDKYKDLIEKISFQVIYFDSESAGWKEQLHSKVSYILEKKNNPALPMVSYDFDVAIITAVAIEDTFVKKLTKWEKCPILNDPSIYYTGVFEEGGKKVRVVTASQNQMGMTAAAVLSMKLISHFRPKYLIMVGIAAGRKGKGAQLGDIIVATQVWDYSSGKYVEAKDRAEVPESQKDFVFLPDPKYLLMDVQLEDIVKQDYKAVLATIQDNWTSTVSQRLKVICESMACGPAVIQNEEVVHLYIDKYSRKTIAIDMESYGVFYAARHSTTPTPKVLCIKSICDYADSEKNDDYQVYSAYTSTQFMYYLIMNELK